MRSSHFHLSPSIQLLDCSPKGGQPLIHALLLLSTRFDVCYCRPSQRCYFLSNSIKYIDLHNRIAQLAADPSSSQFRPLNATTPAVDSTLRPQQPRVTVIHHFVNATRFNIRAHSQTWLDSQLMALDFLAKD
jgi:hypothetical protein